ncbi:retrovirus-related Pol polyprotein LINE-1 [Elysia marginata]|uniref:Retrovirus-related Pol polyprotein LINE-1 n=1 Tax=Elysia marginata TaxID=1093978 RepID=A0AAV4H4I3_9GAST|nr:retrovirus-related Pol polyprotein LINE-1 [Elysia marginata]
MKCYRKILRIPWCDRVTNEEVLERVNIQNCQLMNNIRKLKLTYFGHVNHNTLEKLWKEWSRARGAEDVQKDDGVKMSLNG